jgi:hypothetical protein
MLSPGFQTERFIEGGDSIDIHQGTSGLLSHDSQCFFGKVTILRLDLFKDGNQFSPLAAMGLQDLKNRLWIHSSPFNGSLRKCCRRMQRFQIRIGRTFLSGSSIFAETRKSRLLEKMVVLSSILFAMPDPALGFWKGAGLSILTNTA